MTLAPNSGRLTWVRAKQPQEQRYPSLSVVCSIFLCPNNAMASSVWDCNVRIDVDACDCTRGLYGHHEKVCTVNRLWGKQNPCGTRDSILHQYCAWLSSWTLLPLSHPFPSLLPPPPPHNLPPYPPPVPRLLSSTSGSPLSSNTVAYGYSLCDFTPPTHTHTLPPPLFQVMKH